MKNEVTMPTPDTLVLDRLLPGTVERVWAYFTDPDLRAKWIAGGSTASEVGGDIFLDFDHRRISTSPPPEKYTEHQCAALRGTITQWEPPHRLGFTWPEPGHQDSEVTVLLAQEGDKVRLRLIHERLENKESRPSIAGGWHTHVDLLEDLLHGRPAQDF